MSDNEYIDPPPPPAQPTYGDDDYAQPEYDDSHVALDPPPPHNGNDGYDDDNDYADAGIAAAYDVGEARFDERGYMESGVGDDAPMTYDFPGNDDLDNPMMSPLGRSQHAESSIGEDIDINSHGLIEETVQRLSFVQGVLGVLILDRDGRIVHATMPTEEAAQLAGPTLSLLQRAREVASLHAGGEGDELQMLCVRTRKHELLMCAENSSSAFAICVVQDPGVETGAPALVFSPAAASVVKEKRSIAGGAAAGGASVL